MNGYGSQRNAAALRLIAIHTRTISVCQNRYLPVPRNRASRSDDLPNMSGSMATIRRGVARGWSSRRRESSSGTLHLLVVGHIMQPGFAPVLRQQVVEHVVDGNGAEQVVLVV